MPGRTCSFAAPDRHKIGPYEIRASRGLPLVAYALPFFLTTVTVAMRMGVGQEPARSLEHHGEHHAPPVHTWCDRSTFQETR